MRNVFGVNQEEIKIGSWIAFNTYQNDIVRLIISTVIYIPNNYSFYATNDGQIVFGNIMEVRNKT